MPAQLWSRMTFLFGFWVMRSMFGSANTMHYDDVIMMAIASQITSLTIVYSAVYSGAHQRKHQSSASLAFVWGIHRGPVNSPHKWPVTRKMFPFDDVIMGCRSLPPNESLITIVLRLTLTQSSRGGHVGSINALYIVYKERWV